MTSHRTTLETLFTEMADVVLVFVKEAESGFAERWVPAKYIKDQLDLKKDSYPVENDIQNRTGWVFAALARNLQDRGIVEFRKEGNRSFYRSVPGT
jgi:precorrin-2 methylase